MEKKGSNLPRLQEEIDELRTCYEQFKQLVGRPKVSLSEEEYNHMQYLRILALQLTSDIEYTLNMVLTKRERKGPVTGRLVTAYDNIRQHLEDSIQAEVQKEAEEVKAARDSISSSLKYSLSSPMTIES